MLRICEFCVIILGTAFCVSALVFFKQFEKGEKGCKTPSGELAVGESQKDELTCGLVVCQNEEGEALIHFCQKTVAFQMCENDSISTTMDFPQCCWTCVRESKCGNDNGGETGGESEAAPDSRKKIMKL